MERASEAASERRATVSLHPAGAAAAFGPFRFDRTNKLLYKHGVELPLPPRVLGVLEQLVERPGSVVSKRALMTAVWSDASVSETSLTEAISLLRQALGDEAQKPAFVQTVHRRGYRFVAPVTVEGPGGPTVMAPAGHLPETRGRVRRWARWTSIVLVAALAGFVVGRWAPRRPRASPIARLSLALPFELPVGPGAMPALALSPDGRHAVFAVRALADAGADPHTRLVVRALGDFEPMPLAGTDGAESPFFSPDGRWIAFFAEGRLKKVPLAGGPVVTLCDARAPMGGAWGPDGTIVFGGHAGLWRLPANGGTPRLLKAPDARAGDWGYSWPEILPDGDTLVFTVWPAEGLQGARLAALSLARPESAPRVLVEGATYGRYADSGHLVFARQSRLMALPLEARGRPAGEPASLFDGLAVAWFGGAAQFGLSRSGTLAYVRGGHEVPPQTLALADRAGRETPLPLAARPFMNLALSPDGRKAAVTVHQGQGSDVWLADLSRGTLERLTAEPHDIEPVFTPDGRRVTFAACRRGPCTLAWIAADGSGAAETLLRSEHHHYPTGWSPDGRALLFAQLDAESAGDLWLLPLEAPRAPRRLLQTPFDETQARFSPDGRWIAYASNETGRFEVYVRPFPELQPRTQVSTAGGEDPRFTPDGRELVFRMKHVFFAAAIETAPAFRAAAPRRLFAVEGVLAYAPAAQGGFVWIRGPRERTTSTVDVVLDWSDELSRLAPPG